jgi:hypothetical protein
MNAVERLLAHGEQVMVFCDEIFRDRLGSAAQLPDGISPASLRAVVPLAIDHFDRLRGWDCSLALFAAGERVITRLLASKRTKMPPGVVSKQIADEYYGMMEHRCSLLDSRRLTASLAEIVSESLEWGPLSKRTVSLSENLIGRLRRLREMKAEIDPDEWTAKRRRLRAAIDALAPYSRPPKAAGSLSKKQSSSKPVGRPQNDEELARDLLDGWRAYKPENGRPRKEDYLAQRPDVRVLKTEQARQAKIASLRTALDSALALRRSKARQKRKARG